MTLFHRLVHALSLAPCVLVTRWWAGRVCVGCWCVVCHRLHGIVPTRTRDDTAADTPWTTTYPLRPASRLALDALDPLQFAPVPTETRPMTDSAPVLLRRLLQDVERRDAALRASGASPDVRRAEWARAARDAEDVARRLHALAEAP